MFFRPQHISCRAPTSPHRHPLNPRATRIRSEPLSRLLLRRLHRGCIGVFMKWRLGFIQEVLTAAHMSHGVYYWQPPYTHSYHFLRRYTYTHQALIKKPGSDDPSVHLLWTPRRKTSEDPKSRSNNSGLEYSSGVASKTLRWIYFLGCVQGSRSLGPRSDRWMSSCRRREPTTAVRWNLGWADSPNSLPNNEGLTDPDSHKSLGTGSQVFPIKPQ